MPRLVAPCPRQPARRRRPLRETTRKRPSLPSGVRLAMDETTKVFLYQALHHYTHPLRDSLIYARTDTTSEGRWILPLASRHWKADVYSRLHHDIGQEKLWTGHSIHSIDNRNLLSRRHLGSLRQALVRKVLSYEMSLRVTRQSCRPQALAEIELDETC